VRKIKQNSQTGSLHSTCYYMYNMCGSYKWQCKIIVYVQWTFFQLFSMLLWIISLRQWLHKVFHTTFGTCQCIIFTGWMLFPTNTSK